MMNTFRFESVNSLCWVVVFALLVSGCDKIKLPAPKPDPEPEVVKSIVPDSDAPATPKSPEMPAPDASVNVLKSFLATPNFQRTDAQLSQLTTDPEAQSNIVELDLKSSPVTNEGLQNLAALKNLKAVNLSKTQVTGSGLAALENVPTLEVLILEDVVNVNDAGVASLSKLPHLQRLNLTGTSVTDAVFKELGEFPELKSLNLDNNPNLLGRQFTEMVAAGKFKQLEELSVRGTQFGFYGLLQVGSLKNLRVLRAGDCNVTDAALETIQECPELLMLDLSKSGLSPVAIKKIVKLKKLEHLDFGGSSSINDEVFNILKVMKHLKILDVNETSVTEAAVKLLKEKFLKETIIRYNGIEY